jgi:Sigma-54 interaction domain
LKFPLESAWETSFQWKSKKWECYESWKLLSRKIRPKHKFLLANLNDAYNVLKLPYENYGPAINPSPELISWLINGRNPPTLPKMLNLILNHIASSRRVGDYRLLYTFVGNHATFYIEGFEEAQPCWFYEELNQEEQLKDFSEYVLVYPELFFKKEGDDYVIARENVSLVQDLFKAHRIEHILEVFFFEEHKNGNLIIKLRDTSKLVPYKKGEICRCIPIPGKPIKETNIKKTFHNLKEPWAVKSPEVVIASPKVKECLQKISPIWQDRFARVVLISSPPGSGKENLAQSIPYGSGRVGIDGTYTISLAINDLKALGKTLFGVIRDDGSFAPGLIAMAEGSSLILDEVHHPEDGKNEGIRPSLLRLFEAKEYFPVGSTNPVKVKDVLFILLTSKELVGKGSLGELPPSDFWTRVTHLVRLEHPLSIANPKDFIGPMDATWCTEFLESLFKFFWWATVGESYKIDPIIAIEKNILKSNERNDADTSISLAQIENLMNDDNLDRISKIFSNELINEITAIKLDKFSIRGIRSIATRICSFYIMHVRSGSIGSISDNVCSDMIVEVIKEVTQIATLKE